MAFLYDFFPVLLFFGVFKWQGILPATAVLIVATLGQVAFSWLRKREVKKMHLVTAVLVLVFGGITLLLEDEIYIKWKVSIVNWLFAAAFLASAWIGERRTIIERMMGSEFQLPTEIWRRLNTAWVGFFLLLGFINWYVMANFDTDTWVDFKLFGVLGLTFVFALLQGFYLARHITVEPDKEDD